MAGALGISTDPTQPTAPPVVSASPSGALTTVPLPGTLGYNPLAASLGVMQSLAAANAGASPEGQAFRNTEYGLATKLVGDQNDIPGALSRVSAARDTATADKMATIRKAMAALGGQAAEDPAMRQLSYGAGILSAADPHTLAGSIGRGGAALYETIQKQREMARQTALDENALGSTLSQLPEDAATAGLQDIYNRTREGINLGQSAMMGDYRTGIVGARDTANAVRLTAAQLMAGKDRYSYVGPDPQDPTKGLWRDKTAPPNDPSAIMSGPLQTAVGRGGSRISVSQWKHDAWLKAHPGDEAGALDYAAGHRSLGPAEIHKFALSQAATELGPGADPADIDARAAEIEGSFKAATPAAAPSGGRAAAPAAAAPTTNLIAPRDGNYTAPSNVIPPRPANAPPNAQYSPSQKNWWWQQGGQWKHS